MKKIQHTNQNQGGGNMTKREREQARKRLEAKGFYCSGVGVENHNGRMISRGLSVEGKGVKKTVWDTESVNELLS